MAHDGKSLPSVKAAMIDVWKEWLPTYLQEVNEKWGWDLPLPTKYVPRTVIREQIGNSPMVGVWCEAQRNLRSSDCASGRLTRETRFVVEILLTRELVNNADDAFAFVDAFEEYAEALLFCLYRDMYASDGSRKLNHNTTGVGVLGITESGTHFDPIEVGADPNTSPVIRVGRMRVVLHRRHRAF